MAARHLGSIFEASGGIAIAAGGGVGRPNLEDPGNLERTTPPEPLQINLFGEFDIGNYRGGYREHKGYIMNIM